MREAKRNYNDENREKILEAGRKTYRKNKDKNRD